MPHPDWQLTLNVGLMLALAIVGGQLAAALRLPRVTAYLMVGLLLGPHVLHIVTEVDLLNLDPVGKLAMALVLFNIGCHFTFVHLRRIASRVARLSAGELGLTFVLVTLGIFALGQTWQFAVLLGALALATAPATTVLVLKENRSEGSITEYATALVVLNNLVAVIAFEALFILIHHLDGNVRSPLPVELLRLIRDLIGSVVIGVAAGLISGYSCGVLGRTRWLVLLIAISTLVLGISEALGIPYLLTFLAMGMTLANSSEHEREIADELDRVTGLLCVVFFVIHGAEMNIGLLFDVGPASLLTVAVGYIVLRTAGKYFGIFASKATEHDGPHVRNWLGAALLSQAGAAIALSAIAADPETGLGELGKRVQTVILTTVVVFEVIGPVLVQMAVLRCGEVPLAHAIRHTSSTPLEELIALTNRVRGALGFDPWQNRRPETLTVKQFMRRNVKPIAARATFDEVVDYIEHSRDNTYPVVDQENCLVGVIRYRDLRNELFDPDVASLVRAHDLTAAVTQAVNQDDPLAAAWQSLRASRDDCVFVVEGDESRRLVGLVRQRDLLRFFARSAAAT